VPGLGSTFTFSAHFLRAPSPAPALPAVVPVAVGASANANGSPNVAPDAHALTGRRALVVEDNSINQQIMDRLLQRLGMTVQMADNGREGVDAVLADPGRYDVVIMDVQMPDMDGLEATRLIRRHAGTEQLPIIAMTAHAMEEERTACLAAGMNDHLTKPVDPKALTRTLEHWIH
jgi:CheY-like chemotaxis protein